MDLFPDSDSERDSSPGSASSSAPKLTVNESYANRFEHNKQRAELHQLEEKYGKRAAEILLGKRNDDAEGSEGSDDDSDESSEDETEDEEGEQVTAEVDAAILRTLAKIRSGDASIYNADARVFDEEKALAASSSLLPKATRAKLNKKVTLADYQRNRLRDLMADSADPALALAEATTSRTREDDMADGDYEGQYQQPLSHVQEQAQLRRQVTQAFHDTDGPGAEEEGDFFTKTKAGGVDGDEDDDAGSYRRYLLKTLGDEKAQKAVREALRSPAELAAVESSDVEAAGPSSEPESAPVKRKSKKTQSEAQQNEDFLMNYVLNRGWLENPQAAPKLGRRSRAEAEESDDDDEVESSAKPKRATGSNGDTYGRDWDAEAADLDSEASFDSRAEAFEQAFNFRFEALESGDAPTQVQSYSRNPQNSVRRTEDKRKTEREERKKRKEAEKKARMEELDRMRDIKKGQLRDKLKQLQEAAGSSRIDFDPMALEGDYDPEKHDAMMAAFGDDYYDEEDAGADGLMKPTWDDDDDLDIADILAEEEEEEEAQNAKKGKKEKKQKRKGKQGGDDEDGPINMDAAFMDGEEGQGIDESKLSKKEQKKLKKQQKALARAGATDGAVHGPSASDPLPQTEEERKAEAKRLAEEYRNLDYEDVVGDLATRFRYTQVPKADYGMSAVEILLANDKDLNDVVGLKHLLPYRKGAGKRPKDLNRKLGEFRRKLDAKAGEGERRHEGEGAEGQVKKRMGKKERQKAKAAAAATEGEAGGASDEAKETVSRGVTDSAEPSADGAGDEEERVRRRKEKKERKRAAKAAAGEGDDVAEEPQKKRTKVSS